MSRLLIVDDDPDMRMIARMVAEECDWEQIAEAGDAEAALAAVQVSPPDVVIMDFHLPGIDGASATEQVMAASPGTTVIAWTSSDDVTVGRRFVSAGAAGHLVKADLTGLREALARAHRQFERTTHVPSLKISR